MADSAAPAVAAPASGTPGGVGYVDPFAAKALPNNGGGAPAVAPAPSGTGQALLVTSNSARSTTANNIAQLQQVTTPAGGSTTSPDMKNNPTNPAPITINNNPAPTSTTLAQDQAKAANQGKPGYDVLGNPISVTPGASDSGSGGGASAGDQYDSAVASITDPGLQAQFKTQLQAQDQQVQQAQANLTSAQALSQNDPAATAAISAIQAKYEQQIQLMTAKNTQLIGRANTSVAAFGGLGPMGQDFLSNEQADADARISNLQAEEQDAVTKAQIAYQTQDAKALNQAMTAYDAANKAKLTALNDLLTASNKQVTQMQAQQKIDAAAAKQSVTLDVSKSTNLAAEIAKNISDAGITDAGQVTQYIQGVAQEYGITNPDILASAVTKAQQTAQKASDASSNTADTIANRDARTAIAAQKKNNPTSTKGSGTDGTYKYTQSDVDSYSALLNQGGSGPDGTAYNGRGTDGYVDPTAYVAALKDWTSNGGTPAGFAKKFPVKANINPTSYSLLPKAIQPAAAAASTYTTK